MNHMEKELEFVNRRFDRDAGVFENIYDDDAKGIGHWLNKNFRKPIYERFDISLSAIGNPQGKTIIDVGCGTGIYVASLAKKGAKRILGVDFSQPMLTLAKEKVRGYENCCQFQQVNFLDASINETFHFSLAIGVFDYMPDPLTLLKKLKAVTTEKVIASFPCYSLIRGPLRQLRYLLTGRGNVYYYTQASIAQLAQNAGFTQYELVPIKTGKGFVLIAQP